MAEELPTPGDRWLAHEEARVLQLEVISGNMRWNTRYVYLFLTPTFRVLFLYVVAKDLFGKM